MKKVVRLKNQKVKGVWVWRVYHVVSGYIVIDEVVGTSVKAAATRLAAWLQEAV